MSERYKVEYVDAEYSLVIDTLEDKECTAEEVIDLLNTFDEQHRLMKEVLQEKIDENEQLKNDCGVLVQSNQDYRKENKQLKEAYLRVCEICDENGIPIPTS